MDARDRFTPSTRQRINVQDLYANAVIEVQAVAEPGETPPVFAKNCPLSVDDLLADRPGIGALVAKL